MKTFTLLFLLFVTPFFINAQSWDFNGDDGGWTPGASTITTGSEFLTLTCTDGAMNPTLGQLSAGIVTADVHLVAVTMRNNNANGPTYMRVSFLKPAGGRVYKNLDISNGDTEFVTYYFDMTNSNWTGTMDDIKIHFKGDGGADFTGTGVETIDFDKIVLLDAYPATEKHVFNFDTDNDTEYWTPVNGTIDGPTGGIITFTPISDKYAKFEQHRHYVVADDYNWLRVKMKNNSTGDNQLKLITSLGSAIIDITTSDAVEQTYEILLDTIGIGATGVTTWTGEANDIILRFADGTTGKSTGTGTFEINSIEFYYSASTAVKLNAEDDISVYPNPAKGVLNIANANGSQITIYDITGKQKFSRVVVSDNAPINISELEKGIYIVSLNSGSSIKTSKVIVK